MRMAIALLDSFFFAWNIKKYFRGQSASATNLFDPNKIIDDFMHDRLWMLLSYNNNGITLQPLHRQAIG